MHNAISESAYFKMRDRIIVLEGALRHVEADNERLRAEVVNWKRAESDARNLQAGADAACEFVAAERDRLRELLREARDSVYVEKQQMQDAYGDRLMHKQKPVIELLDRIDAALGKEER